MLVAQTLTSGCRCEANTNVPGAPRILDPPLTGSFFEFKFQSHTRHVLSSLMNTNLIAEETNLFQYSYPILSYRIPTTSAVAAILLRISPTGGFPPRHFFTREIILPFVQMISWLEPARINQKSIQFSQKNVGLCKKSLLQWKFRLWWNCIGKFLDETVNFEAFLRQCLQKYHNRLVESLFQCISILSTQHITFH